MTCGRRRHSRLALPSFGQCLGAAPRETALWNFMVQQLNQKKESLTVEEMFVQGFRQESTRKTNIYSTAPIFMFFC